MSKYHSLIQTGPRTAAPESQAKPHLRLHTPVALAVVLLLWLLYTLFPGSNPPPELRGGWAAALEVVPGVLGVGALLLAGFTLAGCGVQFAPITKRGLVVLAGLTLLLAIVLPAGS